MASALYPIPYPIPYPYTQYHTLYAPRLLAGEAGPSAPRPRRYYRSVERRQRDIAMFPPGRVIFVRPLKVLSGKHGPGRKLEKRWDCVWVTPEQLMSEGILISKKARPAAARRPRSPASRPVARHRVWRARNRVERTAPPAAPRARRAACRPPGLQAF
jgi:hypothetical protein